MSYLQKQMKAMRFDKRLIELNIKTQIITEAEYAQHIASLDDRKSVAEALKLFRDGAGAPTTQVEPSVAKPSLNYNSGATTQVPRAADPFGSGY